MSSWQVVVDLPGLVYVSGLQNVSGVRKRVPSVAYQEHSLRLRAKEGPCEHLHFDVAFHVADSSIPE